MRRGSLETGNAGAKNQDNLSDNWTTVILPGHNSLRADLKELWQYRELVWTLVRKDFKTMYAQTILGPLWLVITAVFSSSVMTLVFGRIAGLSTDGVPQFLFYMSGTVLWMDFQGCVSRVSGSFLNYANLMGKVYFPRLCIPISTVISGQFQFLIQGLIFLAVYVYSALGETSVQCGWQVVFTPFLILQTVLLALGIGLILASVTVKYRDLSVVVSFGLQLWMYATPVVYPVSQVPDSMYDIYMLNPMAPVMETMRRIWFGSGEVPGGYLAGSIAVSAIVLAAGVWIFQKTQRTFADKI